VKIRWIGYVFASCAVSVGSSSAADSAATVTEAVNQVTHGSSQATAALPAKVGTPIQDGEYLKTGVKSRAELQLANQSITRVGANTIFNYSVGDNEVDLQAGTILFSKPKDGKQMTIKTASVTAAVVGTTGFARLRDHDFLFGLVEGHARLTVGGVHYSIEAGQILDSKAAGAPQVYSFNIPAFVQTSPLITRFSDRLPNQAYIDREVAEYNNLVARGFVQPGTEPLVVTDFGGAVPTVPITATDSAGTSHHQFNNPPPPPAMPPPPPPTDFPSGELVRPAPPVHP
jgi:hypothetical protein